MQTICEFSFRCQPKLGRCNTQNTTGVSAADRVTTIHAPIAENAVPSDLVSPGHIFSLRARSGGVLERRGHIEGSVYLTRLAGLKPAPVMCEPMNSDGTMMRRVQSDAFASTHSFFPTLMIDGLVSCRQELALQKGHAVKALAKDWSADAGREVSCAA